MRKIEDYQELPLVYLGKAYGSHLTDSDSRAAVLKIADQYQPGYITWGSFIASEFPTPCFDQARHCAEGFASHMCGEVPKVWSDKAELGAQ